MAAEPQQLIDPWRELWEQYKGIVDAFDGLIYICSQNYEIEFVNQHFAEMLGHHPLGQKCYQIFYKLDHPCPWCCKEKVIRGKTIRGASVNPLKNLAFYHVFTPFFLRGEVLMMVTMQNLRPASPAKAVLIDADNFTVDSLEKHVA
jgi:hypothetical protein